MNVCEVFEWVRIHREPFETAVEILIEDSNVDCDRFAARHALLKDLKWFLPFSDKTEKAPRRADILHMLAEISRRAPILQTQILQLEQFLYHYATELAPELCLDRDYNRLVEESGIFGAHPDPELNASKTFAALVAIEQLARLLPETIRPDQGGRTNLERETAGSPKTRLVTDCGRLFMSFRPDDMKSTDGGPFHEFCREAYQFVTGGDDPEGEGVGLKSYVQFAAPLLRNEIGLRKKVHRLLIKEANALSSETMLKFYTERVGFNRRLHQIQIELLNGPKSRGNK